MGTKTYRETFCDRTLTTLGVVTKVGETFELDDSIDLHVYGIEIKQGAKWVDTYVAEPALSEEQQAEIDAAANWVEPAPEPEQPPVVVDEPTGGEA